MFSDGYIGITKNPKQRFYHHKNKPSNLHLKRAFEKYPSEEILWDVILIGEKEYCLDVEEKLRSHNQIGWNIEKGGGIPPSQKGKKQSEKHKKAISEAQKGKIVSKETRQKQSEKRKGRITLEQTRQKMSKMRKGRILSKKHALNISEGKKGKTPIFQKAKRNKSGYKGVYWINERNKWQVTIRKNNKTHYLGYFCDIIEAAKAYDKSAFEFLGKRAILNFPNEYLQ